MSLTVRTRVSRGNFALAADLDVPASGITGVLGPSGAGKTTLLRVIAGLHRSPGSTVRLGETVWQDDRVPPVPSHEREIGYVFQEPRLFPHLSVRGNLEFGWKRTPALMRILDWDRATELLGLDALLHRSPDSLSGGEAQRVAIARALLAGPKLLLLDEPLANVDPDHRDEVLRYLERLARELRIPILYVSHQRDEITRLAEHLVLLRGGAVEASGPIHDILSRLDLSIAGEPDAGVVISCTVTDSDDRYCLTTVSLGAQQLHLAGVDMPSGATVRIRIAARDVSIALQAPIRSSIINILGATVRELGRPVRGQVTVSLDAAGSILLARITEKSREELALAPGQPVFAQIKGVAVVR